MAKKKPAPAEKPNANPKWEYGRRPARTVATVVLPARVLEYAEYYGRAAYYQPFCNAFLGGKWLKHPVTKKRLDAEECLTWAVEEFSNDEAQQARAARVAAELEKIAYADPGAYFTWGPEGVTLRDSEELTPEQRAAVAEISGTKNEASATVKIKLHDKPATLRMLGQSAGMFKERIEHNITGKITKIERHIVDPRDTDG